MLRLIYAKHLKYVTHYSWCIQCMGTGGASKEPAYIEV